MNYVDDQRDAQIIINIFYFAAFSCSTCFERNTRSSPGALPSILYHAVWYERAGESRHLRIAI